MSGNTPADTSAARDPRDQPFGGHVQIAMSLVPSPRNIRAINAQQVTKMTVMKF